MNKGRNRNVEDGVYYETHHVIPRCLGGSDNNENLVKLTPEEHYLAHLLLVKIHPGNIKLIYAANMMASCTLDGKRNNKVYGWLRRKFSENISGPNNPMFGKRHSEERRKQSALFGEHNPFYGKSHSEDSKSRISTSKKGKNLGRTPWMKGRNHSEDSKKKISENNPYTGTFGKHPNNGRSHSKEAIEKIRESSIGRLHTEDAKRKISESKMGIRQKTLECPRCNKIGGASNMRRYHFENCKG